jgi:hypothetical protein
VREPPRSGPGGGGPVIEIIKLERSGPVASRTVRDAILGSLGGGRGGGFVVSAEPDADIVELEVATP